mgnify:CR=1 FL=1
MAKFRGFIAIDIESNKKLIEFENEVKKTGTDLKLVEPKNVHITLKFLGDIEETLADELEKIIINAVKEMKSFDIQLKGTGVFPNNNYIKVVWLGIQNSKPIAEIAQRIDEQTSKIGFEKERRSFSPHLTISRVKTVKNKDQLLQVLEKYRDVEFADIKVDNIKLKKSELTPNGPIYTDIKIIKI